MDYLKSISQNKNANNKVDTLYNLWLGMCPSGGTLMHEYGSNRGKIREAQHSNLHATR